MQSFQSIDATTCAQWIKQGKLTPVEAVKIAIDQVKKYNERFHAVVHLYEEDAIKQAKSLSNLEAPFAGVPILLKDAGHDYAGHPSTSSSQLFKNQIATKNSHYVDQIIKAGFIIIGHTNAPEFALKFVSDSALYGTVPNPVNPKYHAGGSSGGSAAAVQLGMVPIAAASDGGGSIRIPASFSGLVGFKPTRGAMPTGPGSYRSWGGAAIDFALTKSIQDTENFLLAMQLPHQDASAFKVPPLIADDVRNYEDNINDLNIAYTVDPFIDETPSDDAVQTVEKTVNYLQNHGFSVTEVHPNINGLKDYLPGYYKMNASEQQKMFQQIKKQRGKAIQPDEVEPLSYLLAIYGEKIPAWEYSEVFDEWDNLANQMQQLHETYDVLIQPATAKAAPSLSEDLYHLEMLPPIETWKDLNKETLGDLIIESLKSGTYYSPYAYIYNLTGQPAISLPVHSTSEGLPIGVMISARQSQDAKILALSKWLEKHRLFEYY